jgi:Tol biopolymer transport system component
MKPSWSQSGSMLTFFRVRETGPHLLEFSRWKTALCVIRADGTGFRELTSGAHADFNPTWTRDGTRRILFNRFAVRGPASNDVYLTTPDAAPGDEVRISTPEHGVEWAYSGLADGRIFIDRIDPATGAVRSFLLTPPRVGGSPKYEEVVRPSPQPWTKLSVSPAETQVAYGLDGDGDLRTLDDVVIHIARFDRGARVVSEPRAITPPSPRCVYAYPRWSADEQLLLYDSNCSGRFQVYAYRPADGTTIRVSPDAGTDSQFGVFEGVPQ